MNAYNNPDPDVGCLGWGHSSGMGKPLDRPVRWMEYDRKEGSSLSLADHNTMIPGDQASGHCLALTSSSRKVWGTLSMLERAMFVR